MGIGGNNTAKCIEFGKLIEDKCDYLMVTVPNYNKPSQEGIIQHFTTIANAFPSKPIIMYNIPSRCGVNMLPSTVQSIANNCDNIVAIKEASGSLNQMIEIRHLCPTLQLFSGDDNLILPVLAIGGVGVISVAGNIIPDVMKNIVENSNLKLFYKYLGFIKSLFVQTNPVPGKAYLQKLGIFNSDVPRLPLINLTSKNEVLIDEIYHNLVKNNNESTMENKNCL